jgi:microcompartment protein CcmL/EutN
VLNAVAAEEQRVRKEFATLLPAIEGELLRVQRAIRAGEAESAKHGTGLIGTLIHARVHTQKLTAALLTQRIEALKGGLRYQP